MKRNQKSGKWMDHRQKTSSYHGVHNFARPSVRPSVCLSARRSVGPSAPSRVWSCGRGVRRASDSLTLSSILQGDPRTHIRLTRRRAQRTDTGHGGGQSAHTNEHRSRTPSGLRGWDKTGQTTSVHVPDMRTTHPRREYRAPPRPQRHVWTPGRVLSEKA